MSARRKPSLFLIGMALVVFFICAIGLIFIGFIGSGELAGGAPAPTKTEHAEEPAAEEPLPSMTEGVPTPTAMASLPDTGGGGDEPGAAIPEYRRLTLEFPPVMRTGDSARIRLMLEVDEQGNILPTAVVEGNVVTGEVVEIPNLYETHKVIAEARLDIAGMEVQPAGTVSEPLLPGKPVTFYWSVRPEKSGNYEGTAWLHLRLVPRDGGDEDRIPISVQFLEINAKAFLGIFSGGAARSLGSFGSVIGTVLGFPFIDDFIRFLFKKFKKKPKTVQQA